MYCNNTNSVDPSIFRFKAKVGLSTEDDKRRLRLIRNTIGPDNLLVGTIQHTMNSRTVVPLWKDPSLERPPYMYLSYTKTIYYT